MVFGYYNRLNKTQKAIYRKSDAVEGITLNHPEHIRHSIIALETALVTEHRKKTEQAVQSIVDNITLDLEVAAARIRVLSARPAHDWGELHGLYEPADARITVWMRTAKHKKVVAFRTFLRTILHELCHHLDYELLKLPDSYHTEGFFKRESSLFKQLIVDA